MSCSSTKNYCYFYKLELKIVYLEDNGFSSRELISLSFANSAILLKWLINKDSSNVNNKTSLFVSFFD